MPPFDIPNSWEWVTVGDVSSSILYGVSESAKAMGAYRLLRITDIQNNNVEWDNVPYTDFEKDKANQYLLDNGDIVFARTGATVGKSYLVRGVPSNAIYASYLIRIKTSKEVYPEYLKLFFESGYYWQQITEGAVGIGQPNVNGSSLGNLLLPIPPKSEQLRIVKKSHEIISLVGSLDDNIYGLQGAISVIKSKILDLAMQGKLVKQDSSDEPAVDMLRRINPKAKIITDNPHYPQLPDNWVLTNLESVCNYGHCDSVNVEDISLDDWILELEDIEKDSGKILSRQTKQYRSVSGIRHRFGKSDVLYSKLRTYLNKVLLAPEDGYCTAEIIPITAYDCILPEYLCSWLRSPHFMA